MNATNSTDRHPLDLLTAEERLVVLAQLERLPRAEREELAATGMTVAWMCDLAEHLLAWRGAA